MFFKKDERVFSLSGTSSIVLTHDISRLWSEFFSYLLVAGFYREGEPCGSNKLAVPSGCDKLSIAPRLISDKNFCFTEAAYSPILGKMISKGLSQRFVALLNHRDLTTNERNLLGELNGIFETESKSYYRLSAKDVYSVALSRNFTPDDTVIAHYTAQTFGQIDFLSEVELPRLYISLFGNIHLSNEDTIKVTAPALIYGSMDSSGLRVTALFSFLSTLVDGLIEFSEPGNVLADMIGSYMFVANNSDWQKNLPITRVATSLYMEALTSVSTFNNRSIPSRFYQVFLYGHQGDIDISRIDLFNVLLDLMVKKMGNTRRDHLFPSGSIYRKLSGMTRIYGREPRRSYLLDYALEALDDTPNSDEEVDEPSDKSEVKKKSISKTLNSSEVKAETTRLPSVDNGGFDPSVSRPSSTREELGDEDTIDLISFDKTGEGVEEDLYRTAVVALNDRLKNDNSINVAADIKDALNFWVNGYLYRTAIAATKEQISSLGLQSYLKNI